MAYDFAKDFAGILASNGPAEEQPAAQPAVAPPTDPFARAEAQYQGYLNQQREEKRPESRGIVSDVASRVGRGMVNTVGMAGRALEVADATPREVDTEPGLLDRAGGVLVDWSKDLLDNSPALMQSKEEIAGKQGFVRRGVMGGVESMPLSGAVLGSAVAGAKFGGMAGSVFGPVGAAAGATIGGAVGGVGSMVGLFFGGTFGEEYANTYKELEQTRPELPELERREISNRVALGSAAFEFGTEMPEHIFALMTMGSSKILTQPATATLRNLVKKDAKQLAKELAQQAAVSTSTEMVAGGGQAYVRQKEGLSGPTIQEGVIESIIPALTMSAFFGAGSAGYNRVQANKALAELNADDPATRVQAVEGFAQRIAANTKDPELAKAWMDKAGEYVATGQKFDVNEKIAGFTAVRTAEDNAENSAAQAPTQAPSQAPTQGMAPAANAGPLQRAAESSLAVIPPMERAYADTPLYSGPPIYLGQTTLSETPVGIEGGNRRLLPYDQNGIINLPFEEYTPPQDPLGLPAPAVTVTPEGTAVMPGDMNAMVNRGIDARNSGLSEAEITSSRERINAPNISPVVNQETPVGESQPDLTRTDEPQKKLSYPALQQEARNQGLKISKKQPDGSFVVTKDGGEVFKGENLTAVRDLLTARKDVVDGLPEMRQEAGPAQEVPPVRGEAIESAPLNIGDAFDVDGIRYVLENNDGAIAASDVETGAVESWPTAEAFEAETGQKVVQPEIQQPETETPEETATQEESTPNIPAPLPASANRGGGETIEAPEKIASRLNLKATGAKRGGAPVYAAQKIDNSIRDTLVSMRREISEGEAGYRLGVNAGNGMGGTQETVSSTSTFPDYFQNRGYTKEKTLEAIDNYLSGRGITSGRKGLGGQAAILTDLVAERRRMDADRLRSERNRQRQELAELFGVTEAENIEEAVTDNDLDAYAAKVNELADDEFIERLAIQFEGESDEAYYRKALAAITAEVERRNASQNEQAVAGEAEDGGRRGNQDGNEEGDAEAPGVESQAPRVEKTEAGDQYKMFATPPTFGKKPQKGNAVTSLDFTLEEEAEGLFDGEETADVHVEPRVSPEPEAGTDSKKRSVGGDVDAEKDNGKVVIEDVGEKLGGAKKDRAALMAEANKEFSDDELATLPLSKVWPKESVDAIEDKTMAAIATAIRAEIPSKPRTGYKVKRWVEKVKTVRELMRYAADMGRDDFLSKMNEKHDLKPFVSKIKLFEKIDREYWGRIDKAEEFPEAKLYKDGVATPNPFVLAYIDGKYTPFPGETKIEDAAEKIIDILAGQTGEKRMKFEVRGSGDSYFINKTGDREYRKLKTFTTAKEAIAYRNANYDDLVKAWEAVKDRDNVKEKDLRRQENKPRTATDYRKGKDVSAEDFAETFGFRGVEFGNWVSQGKNDKERQGMVNQAYDALMDLADIVGVPPKAISLNGGLGLGFGSRGSGWASAHFEPGTFVINLTKTRGAGALAHEWFHALDNYFSKQRGGERTFTGDNVAYRDGNFITHKPERMYVHKTAMSQPIPRATLFAYHQKNPNSKYYNPENWHFDPNHPEGVRPVVESAFAELVKALNASPMNDRARMIDAGKSDKYWSRTLERGARAFENYVIAKMAERGFANDYLANVFTIEEFSRSKDRYPYLLHDELAPIVEAFDNLFATIETKETDSGVAMFSTAPSPKTNNTPASVSREIRTFLGRGFSTLTKLGKLEVVQSAADLPKNLRGMFSAAWHGSPHLFDKFTTEKIGTGEGAQAYGHGLYFASNREVAEWYRNKLTNRLPREIRVRNYELEGFRKWVVDIKSVEPRTGIIESETYYVSDEDLEKYIENSQVDDFFKRANGGETIDEIIKLENPGRLYHVELAPAEDEYLLWDRPLSEQSEKVKAALAKAEDRLAAGISSRPDEYRIMPGKSAIDGLTGKEIYEDALNGFGSGARAASEYLHSLGIRGIKYLDGTSRNVRPHIVMGGKDIFEGSSKDSQTAYDMVESYDGDFVAALNDDALSWNQKNIIQHWIDSGASWYDGNFNFVIFSEDDVEIKALYSQAGAVAGVYHDGKITLVADQIDAGEAAYLMRHEGLHMLMAEDSLFTRKRDEILKQFESWREKNAKVKDAFGMVPEGTDKAHVTEEAVAYFLQDPRNHNHTLVQRMVANVRAWLMRHGINLKNFTDADLIALVDQSLRAFKPGQTRGSAPMFSVRQYTPEQEAALEQGGFGKKTRKPMKQRWAELTDNLAERARQGIVDQFSSLRNVSESAWMKARMSKAGSGALTAAYLHGKLKMDADGALTVDTNGQGLVQVLATLGNEVDDWFRWIAGNRAEKLLAEGKENLFTPEHIAALKSLADGTMPDGRDRRDVYQQTFEAFNEFKKSILNIGRQSGLLNADTTADWDDDFYVPFYRILEEDNSVKGPRIGGGLVRQKAFQKLKGGTQQLNDLLHNTLMNWEHLISASLKNNAAREALEAGETMGVSSRIPAKLAEGNKTAVFVLEDGKKVFYDVADPLVLEAISAISYVGANNPSMKVARTMKRVFTAGITASPEFRVANLLRDTIQTVAVSPVSKNVLKNLNQGMEATKKDSLTAAQMMAGGATMDFGYQLGADADAAKRLIRRVQKEGGILVDGRPTAQFTDAVAKMWRWWSDTGNRAENVNRAATYQQLRTQGKTHAEAAFAAADVLDFRQAGAWPLVRFLTQVVPFLNARIQGLDKLARSGMDQKQMGQFYATVGAYTLAAVALYLLFKDDEDFQAREDWDRDAYLWFKLPGSEMAFRIPAPFEVGAIGSMTVRAVEQFADSTAEPKLFFERLGHTLAQTFSFSVVPQAVQPMLDLYANKDPFTKRQIESMAMRNLPATMRRRETGSSTAAAVSRLAGEVMPEKGTLSPVQIEYLIDGYLGWVGSTVLAGVDTIMRPLLGEPELPAKRIDQYPLIKRFVRQNPAVYTKYTTQFYENLKEIDLVAAQVRHLREIGNAEKAMEIVQEKRDLLAIKSAYGKANRAMIKLSKRIKDIHRSDLTAEQKRQEIERLQQIKNQLAKRMVEFKRRF